MKNGKWRINWLAALAVAAAVWLPLGRAVAQDEPVPATPVDEIEMTEDSATNDVGAKSTESDREKRWRERWERRDQFKNSFDNRRGSRHREAVVVFGRDVVLKTNETAETVVVIGGSATVRGKVREPVVAIGGDVIIEGGEVGDEVVAVLGSVKIGEGSKIHGDVVSVGGGIDVADDAVVEGEVHPVEFENFGLPRLEWVRDWFVHCALKLRPLSFQVGWVWWVFGAFFLFYLLLAAALPRPVQACVDEITRRPATTFFMAILTKLLLPIVLIVLAATGIGVIVIPFLLAALFFGALVGKVAFLEYLGFALGRLFGAGNLKPALALIMGTVLLALLYLVPILGLVVFGITGLWGLGAAVTASFGSLKRESSDRTGNGGARANVATNPNPPVSPISPMMTAAPVSMDAPMASAAEPAVSPNVGAGFFAGTTPVPPPSALPSAGEAYALPRASFWERMGAGLLDMVLAGAVCGFVGGPPFGFLVILAYFAGMWAWKGTTIGGLVVNLKVVRLDDKPVTPAVAIVRALGAAFSAMVLFLGFFWIAWDKERQAWHDMIAGTVVVRVPRGRSLV